MEARGWTGPQTPNKRRKNQASAAEQHSYYTRAPNSKLCIVLGGDGMIALIISYYHIHLENKS